ncbi:MAG TPA: hypothetical protein VIJ16_08760 [Gemmatimonadaceae bacterium]
MPLALEPYVSPSLTVFGSIAELTETVGRRGRKDAKRGSRRTGF